MPNRIIRKVAVLGSGVMGSRIACHFAGVGIKVLLLDIVPKEAVDSDNKAARNKLVNDALQAAIKSNPSPVYTKDVVKRIATGNFTRSEEHTSELQSQFHLVCRLLLEKKKKKK